MAPRPSEARTARAHKGATTALLLLSPLLTPSALAHHPGGPGNTGGAGPINTISASTLPQGVSVLSLSYEHIGLDSLSDATLEAAAAHAAEHGEAHSHVHSMDSISSPAGSFAYGLTRDITLSVRLPHVTRKGIREGHVHEHEEEHEEGHEAGHADEGESHHAPKAETHDHGSTSGIGDLSLLGQWRFMENKASGTEAAVLLGVKAPTGKTDETDGGDRLDAEFQPGSGSWDGMFGLALTQRLGKWSLDGSVLYTAVTEGTQDTDLGDRLHYGVAISYRILALGASGPMFHGAKPHEHGEDGHGGHVAAEPGGPALDLILELNGEWQDEQEQHGEKDVNSGGHTLYVSPGARLSMDKWSAFASVGIPVVNDLNGIQAEPDWRLVTGVTFAF